MALIASGDHLGGDDQLAFGRDRLGGVALDEAVAGLDRPRVGVGDVDAALSLSGIGRGFGGLFLRT